MKHYKHHIGVTSQASFCSVPLRLDAYGFCQFACSFCFAKARGGHRATKPITEANPEAIRQRLDRVSKGHLNSAVDEFLKRRVPIQFGGMTDPFSPWEAERKVTFRILGMLAEHDYPTIISTKSTLIAAEEYLTILKQGNFFVRISFTGAREQLRSRLEGGVPSVEERFLAARRLREKGVAVAARLQPIVLGEESYLPDLVEGMAKAGIQQMSAEYLKWPMEKSSEQHKRLGTLFPAMEAQYVNMGAVRVGRELVLPSDLKLKNLSRLRIIAENFGILFGYAENELLHLNEFEACCNASDRFLRNASFFTDNILGRIKSGQNIKTFDIDPTKAWNGEYDILSYMNSHSRVISDEAPSIKWKSYLLEKWNAPRWRNGPLSFWGVSETSTKDIGGAAIYKFDNEER